MSRGEGLSPPKRDASRKGAEPVGETAGKRKKSTSSPTFEDALGRLEEIAEELEQGDLPLEKAIALAEEGLTLSRICEKQLTEAEGKIEQLVERMGTVTTEPLAAAPDAGEED
jgi:exodeoxyribonuclease VII small subunit